MLATTGMESLELVRGAVRHVRPACVLAVDALAAAAPERLCRTFQLSDAGIVPGSGVGNARAALQKRTLGVPVFCLGVPTVLDAGTLGGPRGMIVTPRDIDAQVRFSRARCGRTLSISRCTRKFPMMILHNSSQIDKRALCHRPMHTMHTSFPQAPCAELCAQCAKPRALSTT